MLNRRAPLPTHNLTDRLLCHMQCCSCICCLLWQLLAATAEAEREVAEVRQLREEEDTLLLGAVQAMSGLWQQLQGVRRVQGGLRLTDVAFQVVQLPAEDDAAPLQAVSMGARCCIHGMGACICIGCCMPCS